MAAVASNRPAVSATLLLALIVTGGCLAMASAIPVANGRRLQQLATIADPNLTSQLQALTSGLQKLSDQLQKLVQTDLGLPSDLQAQLQQVSASFAVAQSQLVTDVQGLLKNRQLLGQQHAETVLKGLLNQLGTKLDALSKQFQNPPQPIDNPSFSGIVPTFFKTSASLFNAFVATLEPFISELTRQLKSTTAGFPVQPVALIAALGDLENAVSLVDPSAPGLEKLASNGQAAVLRATIGELVRAIVQ